MDNKIEDVTIVCDLTVFSVEERERLTATLPDLFKTVEKVEELKEGYSFQFPNEPGRYMKLANYVDHERQCCPFFHFVLEAEANGGPFRLHLTGREGVKEYIEGPWSDMIARVAKQLI
jgi:hypothetical protein